MNWFKSDNSRLSTSIFHIPLWIFIAKELEVLFRIFGWEITSSTSDNWFVSNFIEWFGVLYGILLPLILVRAWEQLDAIDREFDREADTVKILYKDLYYLSDFPSQISRTGNEITKLLRMYVEHVLDNYKVEIKQSNNPSRIDGDKILENIRNKFRELIHPEIKQTPVSELLIQELFERLNELTDIRGDRISLASQRLFENLRTVALITSIVFLVPFYFAGLTSIYVLDIALIISVTFLVVYIYMIIEDLDEPFDGPKSISNESWQLLLDEMNRDQKGQELLEQARAQAVNSQVVSKPDKKSKGRK